MAYHQGRRSIRDAYDDHFMRRDSREFLPHRVVSIVDERDPMAWPDMEYHRGFAQDQWCSDRGIDDDPNFNSFSRTLHQQDEEFYAYNGSNRDNISGPVRRQVDMRRTRRVAPYHSSRSRGFPPHRSHGRGAHKRMKSDRGNDNEDWRKREPCAPPRERSPVRRELRPALSTRSGSNTRSKSFSPDKERGYTYQQLQLRQKPKASTTQSSSAPKDLSVHVSTSSKVNQNEEPPASVTESEEVAAAAGAEPKSTPDQDLKARRAQAIASKALEIEELYRQDCETFGTVVKMLVAKDPSLDQLLQAPLKENLMEIKQRCLDDLKRFIKELEQLKPPEAST